ncbi:MAG: hypothetical protein RLZZ53_1262 [Acidobacteriota bacterium]
MTRKFTLLTALAALAIIAAPAAAQDSGTPAPTGSAPAGAADAQEQKDNSWKDGRAQSIQYIRFMDQRGLQQFETTKKPGVEFTSFKFELSAAFTSQVQDLKHENTALPNIVNGVNTNQLQDIGFGFNTSTANLYLNAQLAPGIRVALTTYLSSRHHNETWVKDGYLQIDESPMDIAPLKKLFEVATVKVGHMEINYGDAHFRRSDNGQALYNAFVGNYIMDAFTTEIGAEVYVKPGPVVAMAAITGGEIRGTVLTPGQRGPAYIGKLGVDKQVNKDVRVRLTGSVYKTNKALSNTLYGGDRAGSRYYWVMENTAATETANATSGYINPGFRNKVQAMVVNPFVKLRGAELFGVIERAKGKASAETTEREWTQYAVDALYRFLPKEAAYIGARYNKAEGTLVGITGDVGAERWQLSAGWFVLPGVLAKAEYVNQKYNGYPANNIRNGGRFNGLMVEGVVAF